MFGNKNSFSCQSNLPFCVDDEKEIRPKTYRGLPQASHGIKSISHHTGKYLITWTVVLDLSSPHLVTYPSSRCVAQRWKMFFLEKLFPTSISDCCHKRRQKCSHTYIFLMFYLLNFKYIICISKKFYKMLLTRSILACILLTIKYHTKT